MILPSVSNKFSRILGAVPWRKPVSLSIRSVNNLVSTATLI